MEKQKPIFYDPGKRAHLKRLSNEVRLTNSNRLRKIYVHEMYSYGFENLQIAKNVLRGVARFIQRSYEDRTPPKAIKLLKKYARGLFKSIQVQQEQLNELSDFMDDSILPLPD